jgi:hypothetical protein
MNGPMLAVGADENALLRVYKWLSGIRTSTSAMQSDPLQPASVRTIAAHCSVTADRVAKLLSGVRMDTTHGAQFVAEAMEAAAILAIEWESIGTHANFEKPVTGYLRSKRIGTGNVTKRNAETRAEAIKGALDKFNRWRNDLKRHASLEKLGLDKQLKKYVKVCKPTKRDANRLSALLKDGKLK